MAGGQIGVRIQGSRLRISGGIWRLEERRGGLWKSHREP